MQVVEKVKSVRRLSPAALVALPAAAVLASPASKVIGHFHVTRAVAGAAITAIVSGGWEVAIVFPWIIPVEATVTGLIAVLGTAAAITW